MSPPLSDEQAARVERHTGLVSAVARRVARSVGVKHMSIEELESVGNEALVQAALRYDPSNPASFATFASYRVFGAMIDAVRKRTRRRNRKRALTRLSATQELLAQAAEDQAAQRAAGVSPTLEQRVEAARELVRRSAMAIRLSEPDFRNFEGIPDAGPSPEQALLSADERERVWSLVAELEPQERAIIEAVYVQGHTMKEFAEQIGTSNSTISRRHARILDRLCKRIVALERGAMERESDEGDEAGEDAGGGRARGR